MLPSGNGTPALNGIHPWVLLFLILDMLGSSRRLLAVSMSDVDISAPPRALRMELIRQGLEVKTAMTFLDHEASHLLGERRWVKTCPLILFSR